MSLNICQDSVSIAALGSGGEWMIQVLSSPVVCEL